MFTRKHVRPLIRESDLRKLTSHVTAEDLELSAALSEFDVKPDINVADDVIGLRSIVSFTDIGSRVTKTIQIVTPGETDAASLKISGLSPLGRVLLGLVPGDRIEWTLSQDMIRTLEVGAVMRTPPE